MVSLRSILANTTIPVESPRLLSECYFVVQAADGYKVVFSWNEIFNNDLGKSVYVIIERAGAKNAKFEEQIAVISPSDTMTGRRFVKGVEKITVKRTE